MTQIKTKNFPSYWNFRLFKSIKNPFQACRTSLSTEEKPYQRQISPLDQAFAVIRDLYQATKGDENRSLSLQTVFKRCLAKGISEDVVQECIDTYTANGILMLDRQQRIIFAVA